MYNNFEVYEAELEYRRNRIRSGVGRRASRVRVPFPRRPAGSHREGR